MKLIRFQPYINLRRVALDLNSLPDITLLAIPAYTVLVLIEMIYAWKTGKLHYEAKDTATSMLMGLGSRAIPALIGGSIFISSYSIWENYRLFDLDISWGLIALAFVLDDIAYYWLHRFGHRIRWMWAAHVIHHSSQHYNLSTALRQTWTSGLTPGFLVVVPLLIIGIEPAIIFFVRGLNLMYQFWIHTEAINKCPRWFEYIMNTPSHHRVHHANNPRYLDRNFAGVFIIWDRIFGTFAPEVDEEACRYGLVQDLGTFNPVRVAIHEWVGIAKDMWSTKSIKDKIKYLIAPPGWTPDGSRMTSEMIRSKWLEEQKTKST